MPQMPPAPLVALLQEHAAWLAQGESTGGRPPIRPGNLREIDMRNLDLHGLDLRRADFSGLVLDGSDLGGSNLRRSRFIATSLEDVGFAEAELDRAEFLDASLRRADLSKSKGLSVDALGGADLCGAGLPSAVASFPGLSAVADVGKYIQGLFKISLVLNVFITISMAASRDHELLNSNGNGSMKLPVLDVPMPTFWFNWIGPFFLLLFYIYMLVYLKVFWSIFAYLPAVFPDGSTLDKRAYPSMSNMLVRYHFRRLEDDTSLATFTQRWVAYVLMLWLVPTTLCTVWLRCLSAHDWDLTLVQIGMLAFSVFASLWTYAIAVRSLGRGNRPTGRRRRRWEALATSPRAFGIATASVVALTLIASEGAFRGSNPETVHLVYGDDSPLRAAMHADRIDRTIVPAGFSVLNVMTRFTRMPFADFAGLDISDRPTAVPRKGNSGRDFDSIHGASLAYANLRCCRAYDAFLARADLFEADLREADLREANLQKSDLRAANLMLAVLRDADLSGSEAYGADFRHAYLRGARLANARLSPFDPSLIYRTTHVAAMRPTRFDAADLKNADLSLADLSGAVLRGADLTSAKLSGTSLVGADLRPFEPDPELSMSAFRPSLTRLAGADLHQADFRDAQLDHADLRGADLREAKNLTQAQIDSAYGDSATQLPAGLDPARLVVNTRSLQTGVIESAPVPR